MSFRQIRSIELSPRAIVLAYIVSAVLWIAVSDRVVGAFATDPGAILAISMVKGWGFVAVTGAMLAILLRRYAAQQARQAEAARAREVHFSLLAEHAEDVISRYRILPFPAFEYVSPSVEAVLGYSPAAFYADPGLMSRLVHPDDRPLLEPHSAGPPVAHGSVIRFRHADGHWVSIEQRSTEVRDAAGVVVAVEGVARDVTDRQATQTSLARLNRVLRTLSAANAALVRAASEAELLDAICRVVTEEGAYRYAWVGYREDDEAGTIRPVASAGYGPGYQVGLNVTWHPTERGMGPVGTSMRDGRTVTLPDISIDPGYAPWREAALALGYASGAAVPLRDERRTFGTLVIYSDEKDVFGTEEVALLEELTANLSYGVSTLRARAEREAREAERTRLVTAIEQTAESVMITDPAANIVYVNPAFERISGYKASEVVGSNPRFLHSGRQTPAFYAEMWATLSAGATWTGELVNRRKDGTTSIEEATITPIVDAGGGVASYVAVQRDITHLREVETTLEDTTRGHAQMVATLTNLRPGETPEVTGQAIADALLGLEGMDSPTVLAFDELGRAVVLGRGGGRGGPVEVGGTLPLERSAELLERARGGAWAERWQPGPEDGEYGARFASTGLQAIVYAPIEGDGGPIGLLAVGTTDPAHADRLVDHLSFLVDLAPTARLLLEQPLLARRELATSRSRIDTIVATRAFHPVFQPIVDLASGAVVGYEALTRFDADIRPDLTFAEARRCGLGRELESVTLQAAVAASAALPPEYFLSLNVSPDLILAAEELRSVLALRTRPIVVELTEHDPVEDYAALRSAFVALGAGLRLAVDDAGAGVANFNHLVELRPQFVKVDMGLVRGVNADLTRQALIVALSHFARATGCQVIAEGVETDAERAVLERLEVPLGQGYLFGRPAVASAWDVPSTAARTRRPAALRAIAGGRRPLN